MKTKSRKIIDTVKVIYGLMLAGVVAFLFMGEIFVRENDPTANGDVISVNTGWERVFEDGSRMEISLPGSCSAARGEVVRLERTLPENQDEIWFCMRASQQDMKVYIGDKLRQEYSTKETRLFGKYSASAFVFFQVDATDAGKVMAIELVSESEYTGFLNSVYMGDKYDIALLFLEECSVVLLVSVLMLVVSSIVVCIGLVLRIVYKKSVDLTYLGMGVWQLSLAMLVESRVRQFFLPNASVASQVGFLLTSLLPYPFIEYVNRVQKGRYKKIYGIISLFVLLNFVCSILLQMIGLVDLADSSFVSFGVIIWMVIVMASTIFIDLVNKNMQDYKDMAPGFVVMLLVTLWETYITLVPEVPVHGGVALSFGLIILLSVAGFKTAENMMTIEREKQEAILASASKAKFLANMSHEIRTPINAIIGMNEMILRESADEDIREYAQNVNRASNLLLGLINDILDFSKIEAGKLDIIDADYFLPVMLRDVLQGFMMRAESKNLQVILDIDKELPCELKGDEIRIRQIFNNVLSNAVKYTAEGKITVTVKGLWEEEKFSLWIAVKDTGIGIRQEDLDRLFESFQRLEEGKNRYIEGTGLGLNITKQLLDLMDGEIAVESEYRKGSCFTLRIPQEVTNPEPMGELRESYPEKKSPETEQILYAPHAKILVVDDSEMNLAVVKALLKRTAIQLELVKSGAECLEVCRKAKFDLILMDHMMPGLSGIDTLHGLREDAENPNAKTPVIVLTANAIAGAAEFYMSEGFADYLTKPIVYAEMENILRKYLPEENREEQE